MVPHSTGTEFCFAMIGRADIEGSKSNVAMNACVYMQNYRWSGAVLWVGNDFDIPVYVIHQTLKCTFGRFLFSHYTE